GGGVAGGVDVEAEFASSAFEALERDFQDVLSELVGDKSLERFRLEYEKLHRALKKSHEQEKRLIKKCRELNGEIVNNAAKVQTALKLSQEDQATIASLRKEIEKAWTMVDAAHDKEVRAKDTVEALKAEISNLSKLVERGAGLSVGQESAVKELVRVRDDMTRQTEEQAQTIRVFQAQLAELSAAHERQGRDGVEREQLLQQAREVIAAREAEVSREQRRRERLDKELREARARLDAKSVEHDAAAGELTQARQAAQQVERQLTETRATMEKYLRDYDALYGRTHKLTEDLEEQMHKNAQLAAESAAVERQAKSARDEATRLHTDVALWERKAERERRAAERLRAQLEASHAPLAAALARCAVLEKEADTTRTREDAARKELDALERGRGLQLQAAQRSAEEFRRAEDAVRDRDRVAASLEAELLAHKTEAARQRKEVARLEREREKAGAELSEAQAVYVSALEDLKTRDVRAAELAKKCGEYEAKLKQQQQLYEGARSDRNVYSKGLVEARDEVAEMKRKFRIMSHQIDQLREEITAKDHALVKVHYDHQRSEKLHEQLRNEQDRLRRLLEAADGSVSKHEAEARRLAATVRGMDDEALRQRKEYDQVVSERDILGTQLIRRNDELALLYEKLKLQQSVLTKGEAGYTARLADMKALRLKLRGALRELAVAKGGNSHGEELRREALQLRRELLRERTRVKALSEELENPVNVHRWRKLEGSDPATYEMVQKIQALQRRLIAKTEETVERELLLQEKDKLYREVKGILARQPGPEVAEQLSVYQASLKDKTRQMKAMAAELNMYQAQVNELRYESERLGRELQDTKRKYYEDKRRQQQAAAAADGDDEEEQRRRALRAPATQQALAHAAATRRFAGGGFAIR
ncbi:unnamed protein product, partial [Phaeothamnion confervicola]